MLKLSFQFFEFPSMLISRKISSSPNGALWGFSESGDHGGSEKHHLKPFCVGEFNDKIVISNWGIPDNINFDQYFIDTE